MNVAAEAAPTVILRRHDEGSDVSADTSDPSEAQDDNRLWLCGLAVAVVVLCGLPYVISALFGPPDLSRMGTFWFSRDFSQYQAAMREGARQSGWLIYDHFSVESHSAALMYPLYVAAGKFAALVGLSDFAIFAVLEWLGRCAVLGATYLFAATFLKANSQRRLAVLLSLFALGLDAWMAPLRLILDGLGVHALTNLLPETINPYLEVSSFGVLLSAPHLMLGLALTLLCAPLYLRALERGGIWLALLGLAVLGLSLVHSFNAPVLVSVVVVHAVLTGRRAWPAAIVAGLAAAPMAIYSVLLYQTNPFWSGTYSAQNIMPAPAPWSLPFDFGLVLLAAPLAWPAVRGWPTERRRLILLWIGLGLIWMYVPVPYQRRFAFGVQPALAVLAGVGLVELSTWIRVHRIGGVRKRLINYGVFLAAVSTSLLVYVSLLAGALLNHPAEVYLWSRPEVAAATWLGHNSTATDVVLASTEYANPLAGAIDGRVVHGHIVATLHSPQKQALVQRFFAADTSPAERGQLLDESQATFVAFGPQERLLGATDVSTTPGLTQVYDVDGVQLFHVAAR